MQLTLVITVPDGNDLGPSMVVDAVNETLNELAGRGVLDSAADDAWGWINLDLDAETPPYRELTDSEEAAEAQTWD